MRRFLIWSVALGAFSIPGLARSQSAPALTISRCTSSCSMIARDAIVSSVIRISYSLRSDVSFDRVRLEARPPTEQRYICLNEWSGTHVPNQDSFQWSTPLWPNPGGVNKSSNCPEAIPHYHGYPTENGLYRVRVVAFASKDQHEIKSSDFLIRLANPPAPPRWEGTPTVTTVEGEPDVLLRWAPNPESDIAEYHFRRADSRGHTQEFAVDANDPSKQGCYRNLTYYGCPDITFTGERSGTYSYSLLVFRRAPSSSFRCPLSSVPCIPVLACEIQVAQVIVPATEHTIVARHPALAPVTARTCTPQPTVAPHALGSPNTKQHSNVIWIVLLLIALVGALAFIPRLRSGRTPRS
ncbi:MAG: hypothetical protein ACYDCC_11315 [Actinomycetota bacterium]